MSTITRETLQFLHQLSQNNNKPWFEKNRAKYEMARTEYLAFIAMVIEGVRKMEVIPDKDPVKYIQRIYRDIRFSKNKAPYKSHFSSIIDRGDEMKNSPVYIQIQPGNSMIGGGLWDPSGDTLKKIRQEIDYNSKSLKKITSTKEFQKYFGKISGAKLTRHPKGYEADNPNIELLKHKQFFVQRSFDDELVLSKDLIPEVLKTYKAAMPFLYYLDAGIGE
jgi:uncharacterized protein (TIGR02453 family)